MGLVGSLLVGAVGLYASSAIVLFAVAMILYATKNEHPPAISLSFAFVLFEVRFNGIVIVIVGVLLLVLSKTIEKKLYRILDS